MNRPMPRVALYARYSSDNQRDASIEDQLRQCREHADREGWTVVEQLFRPRHLRRIPHSIRHPVVACRMRRPAGSTWCCPRRSTASAATRRTSPACSSACASRASPSSPCREGEISELHVGLKGTMNALFLKDLAA